MLNTILIILFILIPILSCAEEWKIDLGDSPSWPTLSMPNSFKRVEPADPHSELEYHRIEYNNGNGFVILASNYGYAQDDGICANPRDWIIINEVSKGGKMIEKKDYDIFISKNENGLIANYLPKNPNWGICSNMVSLKADFTKQENAKSAYAIIDKVVPSFEKQVLNDDFTKESVEKREKIDFFENSMSWPLVWLPDGFEMKAANNKDAEEKKVTLTYTDFRVNDFEIIVSNEGIVKEDKSARAARDWVLMNVIPPGSEHLVFSGYELFIGPSKNGIMQAIYVEKNAKWGQCYQILEFRNEFSSQYSIVLANRIIMKTLPSFVRKTHIK